MSTRPKIDKMRKLVGAVGFEPTTLWSQTRCATRLRYAPTGLLICWSAAIDKPYQQRIGRVCKKVRV